MFGLTWVFGTCSCPRDAVLMALIIGGGIGLSLKRPSQRPQERFKKQFVQQRSHGMIH